MLNKQKCLRKAASVNEAKDEAKLEADDSNRSFVEEILKMEAAKSGMTKKVKRLELVLKDFKELDEMNIPGKSLHSVASEVEESRKAVK